ncbi:glycosyltransferase family 2 protein [Flavobacterium amnicola]|uniref:Glycosyltransferase family 2 protein n=1 Tax=Flavobacterium amnicola TaxID=2506422 RepID=A0A4Q1K1F6_9FLAO|nr:glycosyltransferase family A protein [Flavobacterium amnicola]RXR17754.1 glycosyltransferase family 2 protein [Flavobacterium amnicola]
MRIGFNPNKDKELPISDFFHQVIIPVYIPNQEGYFKHSFVILKYCLDTLFKTSHKKTYFSVINNGSCKEIVDYLNDLLEEEKIHELVHTNNIGKLNAILKGVSGHKFQIVTITDADVLFLNNWQKKTYEIFEVYPKAGAVCPTPSSKVLKQNTSNIIVENMFSKKMKFTPTFNRDALLNFAKSIGNPNFYNEYQLSSNLTISNKNTKAVVGAGHFVTTYRGSIFNKLQDRFSNFSLGGDTENVFLDAPVADMGYWRLSTEDNYAYHMGNVFEPWMKECILSLKDDSYIEQVCPKLKTNNSIKLFNSLKKIFFLKILCRKPIWNLFLQYKGLSKKEAKNY